MKKSLLVAVMFVSGFGALALFGWVVAIGQHEDPLPPLQQAGGDALQQAVMGMRLALRTARVALEGGDVAHASQALDAAKRAADVLRDAAPDSGMPQVHSLIEQMREALENGDRDGAGTRLELAVRALEMGGALDSAAGAPPGSPEAYEGAAVIDARGIRRGEVISVRGTEVELSLGRGRNTFGFIDFDGRTRIVPAERVLFGKPKGLGATMVMVTGMGSGL